jgi:transcription elongation GreA/GreB family factor
LSSRNKLCFVGGIAIDAISVFWFDHPDGITSCMKRDILDAVLVKLEAELSLLRGANEQSSVSAMQSAPHAEKQRDTTGLEAAYLAHGYSMKCNALARQLEELQSIEVEDFTGQEIDVGALVEVEMGGETDWYLLLPCGGGCEVEVDGGKVTVITPESPLGLALMGNVEAGFFTLRNGSEGLVLQVL